MCAESPCFHPTGEPGADATAPATLPPAALGALLETYRYLIALGRRSRDQDAANAGVRDE